VNAALAFKPSHLRPWLVLAFVAGLPLGAWMRCDEKGTFGAATKNLGPEQKLALDQALDAAIYDAAWRLAPFDALSALLHEELGTTPETDAKRRVVLLMRVALISDNPEGQSAIFSQVCGLAPTLCERPERLREAVRAEAQTRQISPGNRLPWMLVGEHHHD
jgi:hypothetical protein